MEKKKKKKIKTKKNNKKNISRKKVIKKPITKKISKKTNNKKSIKKITKTKKNNFKILYLILGTLALCLLTSYLTILMLLDFKLLGDKEEELTINKEYEEKGYVAKIFNNNLDKQVKITNNIDSSKEGYYIVKYKLKVFIYKFKLKRKIHVTDNLAPDLKLVGETQVSLNVNHKYVELGAIAIDNYDGDLTQNVSILGTVNDKKVGKYELTYKISDSSGNESQIKRTVEVLASGNTIPKNKCEKEDTICNYLNKNNYNVSLGYYNLKTGENYFYRQNNVYYGASLIKTVDVLYLYDNNLVTPSLKTKIKPTIEVSNNETHAYLVNYIGFNKLKQYGKSLGAKNTLEGSDNYGNTTVADQMIYMKKLYEISKNNKELRSYFLNAKWNYLKIKNIPTMHKYGFYNTNYHESGIILDEEPYILIVLTPYGKSNYSGIINNISKKVYEYHQNLKKNRLSK